MQTLIKVLCLMNYCPLQGDIGSTKQSTTMTTINLRQALRMTIQDLALSRREVAENGGTSDSSLSRFLAGETDLGANRLESVVNALPEEAKSLFFSLLNPALSTPNVSAGLSLLARLENYLKHCGQKEFMEVLKVLVDARRERQEAN